MSGPLVPSPAVVLVEDDPAVLNSLRFAFELEGFHVSAYDSAEALLAAGPLPERACLVVDQRLPGMDGLSLLRCLRELDGALPALLITTSTRDLARRAANAGVPLVDKPLVTDKLVEEVRRQLA